MIAIKDVNGKWVCLLEVDVVDALANEKIRIMGMSVKEIVELKYGYDAKNGEYPITEESVRKVWG